MSSIQVSTLKLQEMVSKAMKGVGNNKLLPITSLMAIKVQDDDLYLITTDGINYLYIREPRSFEEVDFSVVVNADLFSQLIARLTCEKTILEITDNSLVVVGNGTYHIELPLDEEGNLIKYPNPLNNVVWEINSAIDINLSTIDLILNSISPSLSTTLDIPCYTGYWVGDKVVATDTYKIGCLGTKLLEEPKLISAATMKLLSLMTDEKIKLYVKENTLFFRSENCMVYGKTLDGIQDFQIDAIGGLLEQSFDSMCRVSKQSLLQLLDRLMLFVGVYDKNAIELDFTKEGIEVSSKLDSGVEVIEYQESENYQKFSCLIDIEMLYAQVKAQVNEVVEIWYGKDNAIRINDDNITKIIALIEE